MPRNAGGNELSFFLSHTLLPSSGLIMVTSYQTTWCHNLRHHNLHSPQWKPETLQDTYYFWGLQEKYDRWFWSSNNSVLYNQ